MSVVEDMCNNGFTMVVIVLYSQYHGYSINVEKGGLANAKTPMKYRQSYFPFSKITAKNCRILIIM